MHDHARAPAPRGFGAEPQAKNANLPIKTAFSLQKSGIQTSPKVALIAGLRKARPWSEVKVQEHQSQPKHHIIGERESESDAMMNDDVPVSFLSFFFPPPFPFFPFPFCRFFRAHLALFRLKTALEGALGHQY
jgi:hypothetical protein